jgi:hypothetical protein
VDTIHKIGRVYGYTVCLAAIITFLVAISSIVGALYDRANPLRTEYFGGDNALTSFEAFKATHGNENPIHSKPNLTDTLTDAALRAQYDARVTDRIADIRYTTAKSLGKNGLLLLLTIILFAAHWRWVRSVDKRAAA